MRWTAWQQLALKSDASSNAGLLPSEHAPCRTNSAKAEYSDTESNDEATPLGPPRPGALHSLRHTGASSCFSGALPAAGGFAALDGIIAERARAMADSGPSSSTTPSYTQQLLADRNLRLKKLGEEATELTVACADEDGARAAAEAADLFYHALVALRALGVGLDDVAAVLARRCR